MADDIPQWAKERACELANSENQFVGPFLPRHCDSDEYVSLTALARYIAAHEDAPRDPLLIEARRLRQDWLSDYDGTLELCVKALKRGIEIAGER